MFSINIGRALAAAKRNMHHGEFRAWAEGECKLKASTVTYYLKCARQAEQFQRDGVNPEKMSTRMLLRLDSPSAARELKPKPRDERAPSNRKRGELNRLVLELEFYASDDPALCVEVLLPKLRQLVKQLSEVEKRQRAVGGD